MWLVHCLIITRKRCIFGSTSSHLIYTRVVGAPQIISQPVCSIFPCSPLPSGTCRTPGLAIPRCCPPTSSSFCLVLSSSPFTVPCKMVLARPDERKACPYHCSLRLFTMVRRPSCRPIACWTLAMIGLWSDYFWSDHLNTEKISRKVVGEYESTCECLGLQLWFSIWLGLTRVSFVGSFFY